jgi:hypothetical protein
MNRQGLLGERFEETRDQLGVDRRRATAFAQSRWMQVKPAGCFGNVVERACHSDFGAGVMWISADVRTALLSPTWLVTGFARSMASNQGVQRGIPTFLGDSELHQRCALQVEDAESTQAGGIPVACIEEGEPSPMVEE